MCTRMHTKVPHCMALSCKLGIKRYNDIYDYNNENYNDDNNNNDNDNGDGDDEANSDHNHNDIEKR